MSSPIIKVQNICCDYSEGNGYRKNMINDISFDIERGEIISLFTNNNSADIGLLKIISGLIKPDSGDIISETKTVFIPSEPSSFPWLDVKDNIVYNLNNYDEQLFEKIIQLVGLNGYENHFPDNKSFGFRFRISVARAMMHGAEVLVLDKPFAFMDTLAKKECKELVHKINSDENLTVIFTSSNIFEAMKLSDKIVLIRDGADKNIETIIVKEYSEVEIITKLGEMLDESEIGFCL